MLDRGKKIEVPSLGRANLKIRRRVSPWAGVLPLFRWFVSVALIVATVTGVVRFLAKPWQAGALDFTAHIIGVETGAVGVLGMDSADIDGDDDVDIVTVGLDGIKVYINNDDGTFTVKLIDDKDGVRVQIIDLDNDGKLDLLVGLKNADPSVKWYMNNDGLEFTGVTLGSGTDGIAYAGDIDADGANDIVTATIAGENVILERWMNNGSGTFSSTILGADTGVKSIAISDIDGNGYSDIIIGGTKGLQRWNTSDGYSWSKTDIDDSHTGQEHLVVADVNGDGKEDIVVVEPADDIVMLYRNLDYTSFERIELAGNSDAVTVVVRDIEEDGDEDIIVAGQDDNSVYWYDNNGSEEFTKRTIATGLQSVFGIDVVDIDGDDDFDIIAGDHFQGNVYWYERTLVKPIASAPDSITQSTDASGLITFETTLSDEDRDATRVRVQYSVDGVNWYKPWLKKVTASAGSVDLKNSNGYQVGTVNAIDTNSNSSVKLTMEWDTRSVQNTGGPFIGDISTVQLRVMPWDGVSKGKVRVSSTFRVDNEAPQISSLNLVSVLDDKAEFSWLKAIDSSVFNYKLYYGTDHVAVLERTSEVWDEEDDTAMADIEVMGTTVTDLLVDTQYTFKLFVTDIFGNVANVPSKRVTTRREEPVSSVEPIVESPLPPVSGDEPQPTSTSEPEPIATPTVSISKDPLNLLPESDAGKDQLINSGTLVILDGTSSSDPEGTSLSYSWRQISGASVDLVFENTATPSFTAGEEGEVYIFSLVVRDFEGLTAEDNVTVATRLAVIKEDDRVGKEGDGDVEIVFEEQPGVVLTILQPINIVLFILMMMLSLVTVFDRLSYVVVSAVKEWLGSTLGESESVGQIQRGRVVHFKTGKPIAGAEVLVLGSGQKVIAKKRTNIKGVFTASLEMGEYTITVKAEGFTFSPGASSVPVRGSDMFYSGGVLKIGENSRQLQIVIPMKPSGESVGSLRRQALQLWQSILRRGHVVFWPTFVVGAIVNTVLLVWVPGVAYLVFEVVYVVIVIVEIALAARGRASYGLVRDAITHVPIDLAVVRLYEQGTNRLIITRVTDGRGKFFALPPPGVYMITVAKKGYVMFTKDNVEISLHQNETVQIRAELMPMTRNSVAPVGAV